MQYVYIFCIVFIICFFILAQKIRANNKLGYYTIIYNYMRKEVYIVMCVVFQKYMHTCGESVIKLYVQQTMWV